MVAAASYPIVSPSSRFEVTAVATLSTVALLVWFVVLPLELALALTAW